MAESFQQLLSILMALAGGGAMIYACGLWLFAGMSRHWPTVAGEVISATRGSDYVGGLPGSGRAKVVTAVVEYQYRVRGRRYSSTKVCIGGSLFTSFPDRAERILARYPEGAEVSVHHHPKTPRLACLEPRTEVAGWTFGAGVVLLLASWLLS